MVLKDSYGRPLLNLRIAVTSECNLNCSYCHREGEEKPDRNAEREMTVEEIVRIARIASELGASRVKLTGGEPLMRKDIVEIVEGIASTPHIAEVSMTTNGTRLDSFAKELHARGLKRVNVNLPTLDREAYHKLTGGFVEEPLRGIKTAVKVGFSPVKINMLVLKGVNESDVQEMIKFAGETGMLLQLIELERINLSNEYYSAHHASLERYEARLKQEATSVETRRYMQSRRIYCLSDVKVEVVRPKDNSEFCMHCTRLRVTSNGKLKPCLMKNSNVVDVLSPMRNDATDQELVELFKLANQKRQPYVEN
jgi:cyclic pyranopterin phosphate synthase